MWHQITLVGHLGREPEMNYTQNGDAVTNLNVAVDNSFKGSDGEQVKRTIWVRVSVWRKQAEAYHEYLHKGSKVLVVGKLNADPETGNPKIFNRQDGTAGTSYEIVAREVRFLTSKAENEALAANNGSAAPPASAVPENNDIPF